MTAQRVETLRNPSLTVLAAVVIVAFVAASFLSDVPGLWWAGAVFAAVFGLRPSLKITPDGLIVSNLIARTYAWHEIAGIGMAAAAYPLLTLELPGGARRRVWAVGVGKGGIGRGWSEQTARRVRARWEHETGMPPTRDYLDR